VNKIEKAHLAVEAAENALADAQHALEDAKASRDAALAEVGWRRLIGGFNPNATPLYTSDVPPCPPDLLLTLEEVLAFERQAA
jgi:hypothetical protein